MFFFNVNVYTLSLSFFSSHSFFFFVPFPLSIIFPPLPIRVPFHPLSPLSLSTSPVFSFPLFPSQFFPSNSFALPLVAPSLYLSSSLCLLAVQACQLSDARRGAAKILSQFWWWVRQGAIISAFPYSFVFKVEMIIAAYVSFIPSRKVSPRYFYAFAFIAHGKMLWIYNAYLAEYMVQPRLVLHKHSILYLRGATLPPPVFFIGKGH